MKNRVGETRVMNCGEIAFIVEYNLAADITIQFKATGELVKCTYSQFKKGEVKSHFTPTVFGVGITGTEPTKKDGKLIPSYSHWKTILDRVYSESFHKRWPTYADCSVSEKWLHYPNFKKWYDENFYEIDNQVMNLDKDILIKGNKHYSEETCIFVPQDINKLFVKCNAARGNCPIGTYYKKETGKYVAHCTNGTGSQVNIGSFNTPEEAFEAYKQFKENYIKQVADKYKGRTPNKLYNAMIKYKVEITD